jgi:O-acetyl-ADP-ribose deacetylase (regulator of RNase III)
MRDQQDISIAYLKGDATQPIGEGKKIIAHICNNEGRWGRGFVMALSKRWSKPENEYRKWSSSKDEDFELGSVQFVTVEDEIMVANMISQAGIGIRNGRPPIRYDALATCLDRVAMRAKLDGASVHAPRIGCGLAGGRWDEIEKIIQDKLIKEGIGVFIYDLPS